MSIYYGSSWVEDIFQSHFQICVCLHLLNLPYCPLSYDVAVIQWIKSCHKNRLTTRNNTLARRRNVIDNVRVNNVFPCGNNGHFGGDKIPF